MKAGEDFAALAKESSIPITKIKGAIPGLFPKGSWKPLFEEAAFSLPVGGISEPVETRHGFHIIELFWIIRPKEATFEDVKEKVKEQKWMRLLTAQVQSILGSGCGRY